MGMSQEDIEALMGGIELPQDESKQEIEDINKQVDTDDIEALLNSALDEEKNIMPSSKDSKIEEIGTLLEEIENSDKTQKVSIDKDEIGKEWSSSKINEGIFPFPAENDTKVVSQLSQVANDSEEKVSQIFDVLSLALDNNGEIRNRIKAYDDYVVSQKALLNQLCDKFPNIVQFKEQLEKSNEFENSLKDLKIVLDNEDVHIFQGMELMQFNDINRQKIERVMSVIRKLSKYLNNLFEDDSSNDIPMAKHIHGDKDTEDLVGDDLDKLIAEFNN
ncbi:hypothetical protein AAX26_00410 [Aliarcobacter thereius]|uniref:Chemotaxis protein CheZ n=2 Tax=Aliarcobacter thereius TaxID=544718 RepID=A0A1C0B982_9BACT|nr:hypothetical protein [Aliarcobacter thereius]OCL88724.1 hypothetical protein AAX26_00410 [Aliarcobacter thereius]OCL92219.1 hypothetical protein AAX25_00949 [Aliarcobacter thereius]OCL94685.1 hypothetical protein AA347_00124 [Aliarcobacter thereius LMG 24486]OCM00131.1 hypothetical protein AAX29_00129 [Aliarcobacter thereius]QBF15439.1 hypothetical protein ATH_0349 [Aliarcobacter thereius LMG 24486]